MADTSKIPARKPVQLAQNAAAPKTPDTKPATKLDTFQSDKPGPEKWPAEFVLDTSKKLSSETTEALDQFFKKDGAALKILLHKDVGRGGMFGQPFAIPSLEINQSVYQQMKAYPIVINAKTIIAVIFEFHAKEPVFKTTELVYRGETGHISVGGYATKPKSDAIDVGVTQTKSDSKQGYQVIITFGFDFGSFGASGAEMPVTLDFTRLQPISKDVPQRLGLTNLNDVLRFKRGR